MKYNVISIPRSGSGYIRSLISKNLEINEGFYSVSEPFNWSKKRTTSLLEMIEQMRLADFVVTKNHISELTSLYTTHPDMYSNFFQIPFTHILLLRKDIFECTLSRCIAHVTNQWSDYTYTSADQISVSHDLYVSELRQSLSMWEYVATDHFNVEISKVIYYEDLSFSYNDLSIFGIAPTVSVEYEKSPDKNQLVLNYDELKEATLKLINTISIRNVNIDGLNLSLDL